MGCINTPYSPGNLPSFSLFWLLLLFLRAAAHILLILGKIKYFSGSLIHLKNTKCLLQGHSRQAGGQTQQLRVYRPNLLSFPFTPAESWKRGPRALTPESTPTWTPPSAACQTPLPCGMHLPPQGTLALGPIARSTHSSKYILIYPPKPHPSSTSLASSTQHFRFFFPLPCHVFLPFCQVVFISTQIHLKVTHLFSK